MTSSSENRWVVVPRPVVAPSVRLFCFPYAGSGPSVFRSWPALLPPSMELVAVHLPGRESRMSEVPFRRTGVAAEAIADALQSEVSGAYAVYGHSMGALLGFETVRGLIERGLPPPLHLFVSGFRGPSLPDDNPSIFELPDVEFLAELARLNGTPQEVLDHPELMELMLPLIRADFELVGTYHYAPGPPLPCPITAIAGEDDPEVDLVGLEAWAHETASTCETALMRGDHFFLNDARQELIARIASDLTPR